VLKGFHVSLLYLSCTELLRVHVKLLGIYSPHTKHEYFNTVGSERSRRWCGLCTCRIFFCAYVVLWAGWRSRYSDLLQAGRSGDRIPVGPRFSAPVQTGPGAHPASGTMGTGSFPGVKSGRGVTLTPHPLLVPWSRKSRAVPLLPLWTVRPVQSLSACTRVHFTFFM